MMKRVMGLGLISFYQNQQRQRVLLATTAKEKIALEAFLQVFR